jgi:ABC-type multidrug transport system fused ATPase/permease subunit
MFSQLKTLLYKITGKSNNSSKQPINKISLVIIILIDVFILVNVFTGLNDIGNWYISPYRSVPCYSKFSDARNSRSNGLSPVGIIKSQYYANQYSNFDYLSYGRSNQIGEESKVCDAYKSNSLRISGVTFDNLFSQITSLSNSITQLQNRNSSIRSQYDSALLEKIANQDQSKSSISTSAETAKQELDKNNSEIYSNNEKIKSIESEILNIQSSKDFVTFIGDAKEFQSVEKVYNQQLFWYPIIQFMLQAIFLAPLIIISIFIHRWANKKNYDLLATISWNLFLIFLIPLIFKILEVLQFGFLFSILWSTFGPLFANLLFVASYLLIIIIPVGGYFLIKLLQATVFNKKKYKDKMIQNECCTNCSKKIKTDSVYCGFCGTRQYKICKNCSRYTHVDQECCTNCGFKDQLLDSK